MDSLKSVPTRKRVVPDDEEVEAEKMNEMDSPEDIVSCMTLKPALKELFSKGSPAPVVVLATFRIPVKDQQGKTSKQWKLLVRDGLHMTSAVRTDDALYKEVMSYKLPALLILNTFTLHFEAPEAFMIVTSLSVLCQRADLESVVQGKCGLPVRLDVAHRSYRRIVLFEADLGLSDVQIEVAVSDISREPWTDPVTGERRRKITFVASDGSGRMRGAVFSENSIKEYGDMLQEGCSVRIINPKFKAAKPDWNKGFPTDLEFTFVNSTRVVRSDVTFASCTV